MAICLIGRDSWHGCVAGFVNPETRQHALCAGGTLAPAVRAAMVEPWRPAAAAADPARFAAAAALLAAALAAHPSLVDALLFPTELSMPSEDGADVRADAPPPSPQSCTQPAVLSLFCRTSFIM